jgi:predicted DNA-binding protein
LAVAPIDDTGLRKKRRRPMGNLVVRVPQEMKERLEALANHRQVEESDLIRLILSDGIKELEEKWGLPPKRT